MVSSLFDKFRKRKGKNLKLQEELDLEFKRLQNLYCRLGNSELYDFLVEYFLTKIELNRDGLEVLNPYKEDDRPKILAFQAQIKVINDFIIDVEAMKKQLEEEENQVGKSDKL